MCGGGFGPRRGTGGEHLIKRGGGDESSNGGRRREKTPGNQFDGDLKKIDSLACTAEGTRWGRLQQARQQVGCCMRAIAGG